ncbi:hypothetical protein [Gynuella sunshinyii]|uniref:Uncharacterized protein n=1 Tax=Gynuella sunshinyii YC6258 TaxID=1445510 RepID=A0A0C5VD13_9GAMM|nr:hypothetical protein [Gynuella sunshinyii]AJQ92141.1 hypothetical Protein YC6258_00085 [Gynuella sunshinyii YC6258]
MLETIRKFIRYLLKKRTEFKDLNKKDALLAKVVLDIHRKRTHSSFVLIPLFSIRQIHVIDRENAIAETQKRIRVLEAAKHELLTDKSLTRERLASYLPSVSGIKVVKQSDDHYIAYEGNGRLVALQSVFSATDQIYVEVEEYHFKNPQKILRRMNRVRRLNGLT